MPVRLRFLLIPLALVAALAFARGTVGAQSLTYSDNAANPPYNDGWQSGDNGGNGFSPWTITTTNAANAAAVINSSGNNGNTTGNIDTAGRAWGLAATSGATAAATRDLTAFTFETGDSFAISMDNGFVNNGGEVGFNLQTSSGATLFSFYLSGNASTYFIADAGGAFNTQIPLTYDGLRITFTLTSATTYNLTVVAAGTTYTFNNRSITSGTISRVRLYNRDAGPGTVRDVYFNSLTFINEGALAVTLNSFTATGTENGVMVAWETVSETDMLGFNLLRATSADGTPEQINPELIPAMGGSAGGLYEYEDTTAAQGTTYFYWLDAVETTGDMERFGPVSALAGVPTAVTLGRASADSAPVMPLLALAGVATLGALALLRRRA